MRKKLLLSCLSVIVLAALGIGANADMFKPYERYEIPVETADIIVEEMQEDEGIIEETIERKKMPLLQLQTRRALFLRKVKRKKNRLLIHLLSMKRRSILVTNHQRKHQTTSLLLQNQ